MKQADLFEEWKSVPGFIGLYEVSNYGNVRNTRKHLLSTVINNSGYVLVHLRKDGKSIMKSVHRIVAEAFIPNPNNYKEVNHLSGIKTQNSVWNLEWCTHQYNMKYMNDTVNLFQRLRSFTVPVLQYTKDMQFVRRFESITEATRLGFDQSAISHCLRGFCKTHKGYVWIRA